MPAPRYAAPAAALIATQYRPLFDLGTSQVDQFEVAEPKSGLRSVPFPILLSTFRDFTQKAALDQPNLNSVARERSELREEQRCRVCMDRQRSITVMPCNHISLCYECILMMRSVAGAQRIKCPTCQEICNGDQELSQEPCHVKPQHKHREPH